MPAPLLSSQPQLIQPSDLPRFSMSSDFLSQFAVRPLSVQIVAGGALGVMTWQWQRAGDANWSEAIASESPAPWQYSPNDPAFAILTFAAGTYNQGDVYNVSSSGIVTGGSGGGVGLLTATRFDVRNDACIEITSLTVTWLQPRCVPPIVSVGPQIQGWMGDLISYRLRSRQGMTPSGAGAGDDNARARAEKAETEIKAIGASKDRPPDIVDSSADDTGAGFPAQPVGDSLRGF